MFFAFVAFFVFQMFCCYVILSYICNSVTVYQQRVTKKIIIAFYNDTELVYS